MTKAAPLDPPYAATLAAIRPGSHLCAFYETEDDLLELVVPFCAAGSRRGELCVWMMPDHVDVHTAEATRVKPSLNSALSSTRAANFIGKGRPSKAGRSSA